MLKDLITATEGDRLFSGCGIGLKNCDEEHPCPLHDKYTPIRDSINELVSGETIQSLAGKQYASHPQGSESKNK